MTELYPTDIGPRYRSGRLLAMEGLAIGSFFPDQRGYAAPVLSLKHVRSRCSACLAACLMIGMLLTLPETRGRDDRESGAWRVTGFILTARNADALLAIGPRA